MLHLRLIPFMTRFTLHDFQIATLGPAGYPSPLLRLRAEAQANFVCDERHRVLFDHSIGEGVMGVRTGDMGNSLTGDTV
jgi:hypothetical protein